MFREDHPMRRLRIVHVVLGGLALIAVSFPAAAQGPAAASLPPADSALRYDVLRDGDKIGEHSFVFRRSGDALDVAVKTDVKVKLGFIPLYRFWHDATERWIDGKLVALASKTDDDGTRHELSISGGADALAILHDGKKLPPVAAGTIPASLWHRGILGVPATLNTIDGSMMTIAVAEAGDEDVPAPGGAIRARHYRITGALERELWFDAGNRLVKVRFKAQDKSDIQYVLSAAR